MREDVFVLELDTAYEGSKVLSVFANEEVARAWAEDYFETDRYGTSYVLDEWSQGIAHFLTKNETNSRKAGVRTGQCFEITKYPVLAE